MVTRVLFCAVTALAVWLDGHEPLRARLGLLIRITLGLLTFIALVSWWLSQSTSPSMWTRPSLNIQKLFPYYIGVKYSPELRYDGIYNCSLAALRERERAAIVQIDEARNLSTGTMVKTDALLTASEACRGRFAQQRWLEFSADVLWFKSAAGTAWPDLFRGNGTPMSPAWLVIARSLIPNRSVEHVTLRILSLIDLLLILAMWAIIALTFSRTQLATAAVFWGLSGLAASTAASGYLLHNAWLVALVAAIAALHAAQWRTAGFLTAISSSLTLFPALAALGVLMAGLINPRHRLPAKRVLRSFLSTTVALLLLSMSLCGRDSWSAFYSQSRIRADVDVESTIGLPHLLDTVAQCHVRGSRAPDGSCAPPLRPAPSAVDLITYGVAGFIAVLFLLWLRRTSATTPIVDVAILLFGFLPMISAIPSPYYTVLLLFAFLDRQRKIQIALLALCLLLSIIESNVSAPNRFYQIASVLTAQFVLLIPTLYKPFSADHEDAVVS